MDDSLDAPSAGTLPKAADRADDENEEESEDEDGTLDWTKLMPAAFRPVIPKRGEKEFEPSIHGGSGLQVHLLERARAAMFETLRSMPSSSSKTMSYGVWCPELGRTQVSLARGINFGNIGHSTPRMVTTSDGKQKSQKVLELLPEEAIYMVERGSMFCWKKRESEGLDGLEGDPMSSQQMFTEMIGVEGLSLEKYQVYAYLRRLGYVVTRADPPSAAYPTAPSLLVPSTVTTFGQRLRASIVSWPSRFMSIFTRAFDWWKPLRFRWVCHKNEMSYISIFKSLRFMPAGHGIPLQPQKHLPPSPYKVFFNLYKPNTPFRKSDPPPPDFQLVVVDARTTAMPSLHEFTALFDELPELPPPMPRLRRLIVERPLPEPTTVYGKTVAKVRQLVGLPPAKAPPYVRRPHPFMAVKAGKKTTIIAVVDAGSTGFFRFGQGAFTEWPAV